VRLDLHLLDHARRDEVYVQGGVFDLGENLADVIGTGR